MVKLGEQVRGLRVTRTQRVIAKEQREEPTISQPTQPTQQELFEKEQANFDRLIAKRQEKIRQEQQRQNPREERIERLDAEIDALQEAKAKGASSESGLRFARQKGEVAEARFEEQDRPKIREATVTVQMGATRPRTETISEITAREDPNIVELSPVVQDPITSLLTQTKVKLREPDAQPSELPSEVVDVGGKKIGTVVSAETQTAALSLDKPTTVTKETFIDTLTGTGGEKNVFKVIQSSLERTGEDIQQRFLFKAAKEGIIKTPEAKETGGILKTTELLIEGQREGKLIATQKEKDVEIIEETLPDIEKLNVILEESGYEGKTEDFNKRVEELNKQIEEFNVDPTSVERQAELEQKAFELQKEGTILSKIFQKYEAGLQLRTAELKAKGIEIKKTDGQLEFTSEALGKDIRTPQMRVQKAFLDDPERVDVFGTPIKTVVFGTAQVSGAIAEGYTLGLIAGGSGAVAKLGQTTQHLPKIVKIGAIGTSGLLGAGVITLSAYSGRKVGEQIGEGQEVFNTVLFATRTGGKIGGFVAGSIAGTKMYQDRLRGDLNRVIKQETTHRVGEETKKGVKVKQFSDEFGKTQKGAKLKTKATIEEYYLKKQKIGIGQGRAKQTIEVEGFRTSEKDVRFIMREVATGNVRAKVFTPVKIKGKTFFREDVFLIKQATPKEMITLRYGNIKEIQLLIARSIKVIPAQTLKASQTQFTLDRAFNLERFIKAGKVFSEKEFLLAKPIGGQLSRELVTTVKGSKDFRTFAEGLGFTDVQPIKTTKSELLSKQTLAMLKANKKALASTLSASSFKTGQVLEQPTTILKVPQDLGIKTTNIISGITSKDILQYLPIISTSSLVAPSLAIGSLSAFSQSSQVKQQQIINQQIKNAIDQKHISKISQVIKTQTSQVTSPKTILETITTTTPTVTTTPTTPAITVPTTPFIPFIPFFSLSGMGGRRRKRKKVGIQQYAFFPDFPTRALGLKPLKVNKAQAKRLVRKAQTGFEIRRGAVLVKKKRKKRRKKKK